MVPFKERAYCSTKETSEYLGRGRVKVFELLASGEIESIIVGNRRHVVVPSLIEYAEKERAAAASAPRQLAAGMRRKGESKGKGGDGGKDQPQ